MKLSILSSFMLFGSILAAPASTEIEKRGDTVTSVGSIIATLQNTVQTNVNDITLLTSTIRGNVEASAQVVAKVSADFDAIAAAFAQATKDIVATTAFGVGGVITGIGGITDVQIANLTGALKATIALLSQIQAAVTITASNLSPAAQAAIKDEVNAVYAAILPFVAPLTIFASAVAAARVSVSLVVTGLRTAITGLLTVASGFTAGI
ncbi:uncharacterized protein RAG0_00976 [Rhynchosporium agropyri]|uniref:Uncharacterized protein n=3 Tax=Rhynchosporium TaxID=38037 RepID=A0A1E1MEK1_RHYSE|nr:uncharacterized protein RAG0_00976 [Rhynchosporium agropyri]CZT02602.1 uncharacterized protein RCO7_09415 [Rhynchosporium commune]CZT47488.1 uncharacterized protein RSE6_08052 [Rhynchosporium secalis]